MKTHFRGIFLTAGMSGLASTSLGAAIEYKDALDIALTPPEDLSTVQRTSRLILSASDNYT